MIKKHLRGIISFIAVLSILLSLVGCIGDDEAKTEKINYSNEKISGADFEEGRINELWYADFTEDCVALDTESVFKGSGSLKIGSTAKYSAKLTQHVNGLKAGYYYLEAYALNEGNQSYCYLYGKGTDQGECTTAVPKSADKWIRVVVRGIKVESDGILELGICVGGEGQFANFDNISLYYEDNQSKQYESLFGGAISWLDWVEDKGGRYYRTDKTEADAIQIMAESGCNFVRLELYNNPGDYANELGETFPEGYKDEDAIFNLALRARDKGMKIQLSFMYSDYWGNEAIPSDWLEAIKGVENEEKITEILTEKLYEFTKSYMQRLADTGIYPEYVSLGNEMEGGILLPYGCTYTDEQSMAAFCSFMDAGYRAVKEVSPSSKIVLHISCNASDMFWDGDGMGKWFFDICENQDIKYDVIGTSFYPFWAQSKDEYASKKALNTDDFVEWCNMMIDRYDKDILVMETGYNWGKPGQLSNNGAYADIYPSSPEGQRDFMLEMINAIKCVDGGRCIGDLYWDPVLVRQSGIGYAVSDKTGAARPNVVETTTFFNYSHVALPVLDAYKYNLVGNNEGALFGKVKDKSGNTLAYYKFTLSFGGKDYIVTTDKYGDYYLRIKAGDGKISVNGGYIGTIDISAGERTNYDLVLV